MRSSIVALVWLAGSGVALAQQAAPKVTVSASVTDAYLRRGEVCCQSDPSLPTSGIGGHTVGGVFGFGVIASSRIGIDAEVSLSAHFTDTQEAVAYINKVRHSDQIVSGLIRFRLMQGSELAIEPVAGAGVAFADTSISTSSLEPDVIAFSTFGPFSDYVPWEHGKTRPVITGGLDLPISIGRVAILPTLRFHYIFREAENEQIGVGNWAVRPGIGVRVAF